MDEPEQERHPKAAMLEELISIGDVLVILNPRTKGVLVPRYLQSDPELALEVGLNMATPIPDLEIGELGMQATLTFSGDIFRCWVPWDAVFAMQQSGGGAGVVWPDFAPPDSELSKAKGVVLRPVVVRADDPRAGAGDDAEAPKVGDQPPRLHLVDD